MSPITVTTDEIRIAIFKKYMYRNASHRFICIVMARYENKQRKPSLLLTQAVHNDSWKTGNRPMFLSNNVQFETLFFQSTHSYLITVVLGNTQSNNG